MTFIKIECNTITIACLSLQEKELHHFCSNFEIKRIVGRMEKDDVESCDSEVPCSLSGDGEATCIDNMPMYMISKTHKT